MSTHRNKGPEVVQVSRDIVAVPPGSGGRKDFFSTRSCWSTKDLVTTLSWVRSITYLNTHYKRTHTCSNNNGRRIKVRNNKQTSFSARFSCYLKAISFLFLFLHRQLTVLPQKLYTGDVTWNLIKFVSLSTYAECARGLQNKKQATWRLSFTLPLIPPHVPQAKLHSINSWTLSCCNLTLRFVTCKFCIRLSQVRAQFGICQPRVLAFCAVYAAIPIYHLRLVERESIGPNFVLRLLAYKLCIV